MNRACCPCCGRLASTGSSFSNESSIADKTGTFATASVRKASRRLNSCLMRSLGCDCCEQASPWSLRFAEASLEYGFLASRSDRLALNFLSLLLLILLVCVCWLLPKLFQLGELDEETDGVLLDQVRTQIAVACGMLVVALLAVLVVHSRERWRCLSGLVFLERLATLLLTLTSMTIVVIGNVGHAAGDHEVHSLAQSEATILLSLNAIITLSHLALPVRWYIIWPFEVIAVLCYPLLASVFCGSNLDNCQHPRQSGGQLAFKTFLLALLVVGAAFCRRTLECHERAAYLDSTINPRRCQEENENPDQYFKKQRSEDDASQATSTKSGKVLAAEVCEGESAVWCRLQEIANLGRNERWLINGSEVMLRPDKILGSGGFGVVISGSYHGTPVAVKVPRQSIDGTNVTQLPMISNELRILRHVRHPNIVLFHGACVDSSGGELALVLENVKGMRLDIFTKPPPADPDTAGRYQILLDVCCALRYLHSQVPRIVHGDLKASNILIESLLWGPRAKLVDFGLSRIITGKAKALGGTLAWMAPEVMRNPKNVPAPSSDVYSFGRLLFFIATGRRPLGSFTREKIQRMMKKASPPLDWPEPISGEVDVFSKGMFVKQYSDEASALMLDCKALCDRCLEFQHERRPPMNSVHSSMVSWSMADPEAAMLVDERPTPRATGSKPEEESAAPEKVAEAVAGSVAFTHGVCGLTAIAGEGKVSVQVGNPALAPENEEFDRARWRSGLRQVREALAVEDEAKAGKHQRAPQAKAPLVAPQRETQTLRHTSPGADGAPRSAQLIERPLPSKNHLQKRPRVMAEASSRKHLAVPGLAGVLPTLVEEATNSGASPCPTPRGKDTPCLSRTAKALEVVLALPRRQETAIPTKLTTTIDLLLRWNFGCRSLSCCPWHAALDDLSAVWRKLHDRGCDRTFQPVNDWQCPKCGILDAAPNFLPRAAMHQKRCDICGFLDERNEDVGRSPSVNLQEP